MENVADTFLSDNEMRVKYTNIRFGVDFEGDYESASTVISIIGDRLETIAEARKRLDAKKKLKLSRQQIKQNEIDALQKRLDKLKRVVNG